MKMFPVSGVKPASLIPSRRAGDHNSKTAEMEDGFNREGSILRFLALSGASKLDSRLESF